MTLQPGDLLNDRYRIERILAKGGMGAIYRASDQALNIQVAVKENFREGQDFIRQFRREATLLAGLNHPNLPRVTDHFILPNGGQYLVMDYIEGEDLRDRLGRLGALPESEVVQIGAQVCEALEYLHTRIPPIVHRDIKPGNIKLTPDGRVFLVDFGLAKIEHQGQSTTTGAQALTPGYAPAEQYGEGTETRSDIYALGATLYAALTNKIPEDGLARAMGTSQLTPLRSNLPGVSANTARAIEKAMAVKPAERFFSAAEFRSALLGEMEETRADPGRIEAPPELVAKGSANTVLEPTIARPESMPIYISSSNQPPRKRMSIWAIIGALAVAGGAILGGALALAPRRDAPAPLMTPTQTAGSLQATATRTALLTTTPAALLPDGQPSGTPGPSETPSPTATAYLTATPQGGGSGQIAFSSNRGGQVEVWLSNSDGSGAYQVTNLADGACQPDWSPDGSRLVFVSPCAGRKDTYPGSSLYLIQADGTGLVPLASLPGGDFDPAWSPDGNQIAFTSLRSGKANIYLYNLADNTVRRISSPVNFERRPAWSPDGNQIAYETRRTGQAQIWVMTASGADMHAFSSPAGGYSIMPAWAPAGGQSSGNPLLVYSQGSDQPFLVGREINNPAAEEARLSESTRGIQEARFSKDGRWLAFSLVDPLGASSIAIMRRDGSGLAVIPGGAGSDFHPAWRP